ncbi:F-box/LRR-repeat protein 14-like [Triticum urartu]|uniref:F-box/LRR-repeat protein 14-like n=1 Tax=Triticum urartu TaxID=4572 RepID=UPI0020442EB5|nr:F-box/LRR-repeat protein 14-like [Triticum urartu]
MLESIELTFDGYKGMKALSSAPLLETLELVCCRAITDAGMRFIARAPCLINLTLRICAQVTDAGVAMLVHALKLESLIIEGCDRVSKKTVKRVGGSAQCHTSKTRLVQYSAESASPAELKRIRY